MDSWFNIPAPALVKMKSDVGVEMSCRMKVTVAQADVEATAKADSLKQTPRKPFVPFQGRPYRKPTQVGG